VIGLACGDSAAQVCDSSVRSKTYTARLRPCDNRVVKKWATACAFLMVAAGLTVVGAPSADATVCGSVGGARVDVSGCADPFNELNDALYAPPPPPPAPNVTVCVNAGRRISVSGCV
jgi:hypothetical protein